MKNYRILNDLNIDGRWFLGEVNFDDEWDFWQYIKAGVATVPEKELTVSVNEMGFPVDFNMANFELLIVNEKVAGLMSKEEVQLIPLRIDGLKTLKPYFLMVIKNELACVDEEKSEFFRWEPGNKIRPDKAGQYKNFAKLVIDPSVAKGFNIFRVKDFNVAVIASEELKTRLETNYVKGIKFKEC